MWYAVRCGNGTFSIGHVFTLATLYERPKSKDDYGLPPVIAEQRPIHQTVSKITAYNYVFEKIGQGMTCAIFLKGDIDFDPINWCFGNEGEMDDNLKVIICEQFAGIDEEAVPKPAPPPVRQECGAVPECG